MTTAQALGWANGDWTSSPYARIINGKNGIDVDGLYGFQCVDFVNGYSIYLGNGRFPSVQGAVDLWTVGPQIGWLRVQDPKPGDIHIYGSPFGFNGSRYLGHTGIVTGGTRNSFTSVDQNWVNANLYTGSPPSSVSHNAVGLVGFLRSSKIGDIMHDVVTDNFIKGVFRNYWGVSATEADLRAWRGTFVLDMEEAFRNSPQNLAYKQKVDEALAGPPQAIPLQPGIYKVG